MDFNMMAKNDLEQRIKRVENGLEPATQDTKVSHLEPKNLYERIKHFNVPGVTVAVVNDGRMEWTRGYGLLDTDLQITPNSIFHACSMSKFVTAMAVLKLVLVIVSSIINRPPGWRLYDLPRET